jgi:hypothetical protein
MVCDISWIHFEVGLSTYITYWMIHVLVPHLSVFKLFHCIAFHPRAISVLCSNIYQCTSSTRQQQMSYDTLPHAWR